MYTLHGFKQNIEYIYFSHVFFFINNINTHMYLYENNWIEYKFQYKFFPFFYDTNNSILIYSILNVQTNKKKYEYSAMECIKRLI